MDRRSDHIPNSFAPSLGGTMHGGEQNEPNFLFRFNGVSDAGLPGKISITLGSVLAPRMGAGTCKYRT
jgi:hypothetical protein